ncbi:ABC transporter permease [Aeromicrobium sp. Root495]|uniref:ABC transporter permease n=1 Tax=Aeromicrobium sp. Root495 TaxID=1736550 RepID=UPI000A9978B4|nr:ABC transporter permease [Aeromicrobium sp. Root495]
MIGVPRWIYAPALLGVLFVLLPLVAMVSRVDWADFVSLVTSESARDALWLSLRTSTVSTVLCVVLGVPMAVVLARTSFPGQGVLRSLVLLPLVIPPVVSGIALLYTFGRKGLLGPTLDVLGVQVAFSTAAVVIAQTFVALPFLVISLEGALRTAGHRHELVASTLGASPSTVFRRVTVPLVLPGLVSGAVLAFARALGEFGATITFAGSLQGTTSTLPIQIYLERVTDPDAAVALSLVLVVVAVVVIGVAGPGQGTDLGARRRRGRRDVPPSAEPEPGWTDDEVRLPGGHDAPASAPATGSAPLALDVTVAEREVAVRLSVAAGETVALLGPNGAGKSTVLEVAAGLLRPSSGAVSLGDRSLDDVAPHDRRVALLAQEPLLFPHLDVLDNVAFGPRSAGAGRSASRATARRWLQQVGVADLAERRPQTLSGGQAQRVAVARALAAEPDLLLLDEPMAALDVAVTPALRHTLRAVLADRTVLLVTHDALDALLLADRVVVVDGGRVVEVGPTREVLARPRSAFAAQVAGLNLVSGTWEGAAVVNPSLTVRGLPTSAVAAGAEVVAVFSPSAVAVFPQAPAGSPRNSFEATITDVEPLGDRVRIRTLAGSQAVAAEVTPGAAADLALVPGSRVHLLVKAVEVAVHPTGS